MSTQQTSGTSPGGASTAEVARDQAAGIGKEAASAGGDVARTAKEQGSEVVAETKRQARDLAGETREQLRQQSVAQRDKAAGSLRAFSDELRKMADGGGQSGPATELAHQAADQAGTIAGYLERHEPGELVEQLRGYARRKPGTFLLGAALAGVVAGRLVKAARADSSGDSTGQAGGGSTAQGYPTEVQTSGNGRYETVEPGTEYGTAAGVGGVAYPPPPTGADPAYQQPYQDPAGAGTAYPGQPGVTAPGYGTPQEPGYGTSPEPGYATPPEPGFGTQAPADPSWRQEDPDRGWTP
jgi:hypothetical protein